MWEIDIGFQMLGLICSLPLGVAAAFLYDVLRALNKTFKLKTALIFVLDIVYWLLLSVLYFMFFMVFANGQPRMYVFAGSVAGFIFSRLTLSKIFLFLLCRILSVFSFLGGKIRTLLVHIGGLAAKRFKKHKKSLKKPHRKRKKA